MSGDRLRTLALCALCAACSPVVAAIDAAPSSKAVDPSPGTTLTGSGGDFGASVAGNLDVNGDGWPDVIVGAPSLLSSTGAVYLYLGSATGLDSTSDGNVTGAATGDILGEAVAGAGDVNGDGFDDLIVGAEGGEYAWIFHGSDGGIVATADTELTGTGGFGDEVASAGDVNGDGYDDVLVSAPDLGYGAVYVFHGSAAGVETAATTTLTDSYDQFGAAIAPAGDIDSDGYDDVLVVALDSAGSSASWLYGGQSTGLSSTASVQRDHVFAGEGAVLGLDSNGDGVTETAVASTYTDDVRFYEASDSAVSATLSSSRSDFGQAMAAGDFDGDGRDDLVVGSDDYAQVFAGSPEGVWPDVAAPLTTPGNGDSLANAGDLDGDGAHDLLIGAPDEDEVYVHYGVLATDADADGWQSTLDCDDADATVNPAAEEVWYDEIDADCAGDDDGDQDGDGVRLDEGDCDDTDARVSPDGNEIANGTDDDCDGIVDEETSRYDDDGDGYSEVLGDCDDTRPDIGPEATEIPADLVDSDCDGGELCWADEDGDGWHVGETVESADTSCSDQGETAGGTGDCDPADAFVFPGAEEVVGDGIDQDCDGGDSCYADQDADGDGFIAELVEIASADLDCDDAGEVGGGAGTDCDDADAAVHSDAEEVPGDEVDQDCDGGELCYLPDEDGDAYRPDGTIESADTDCRDDGEATDLLPGGDCDDRDSSLTPGNAEIVENETDENCDGLLACYLTDEDGDGYASDVVTTTAATADWDCWMKDDDCDDANADISPSVADESCDGVDDDCDGRPDDGWTLRYLDADSDGYVSDTPECVDRSGPGREEPGADCDDGRAWVNPGAQEDPSTERDEDCNLGVCGCGTSGVGAGAAPVLLAMLLRRRR